MPASSQAENPSAPIPVDLVTTSASGLDPDITPGGGRFPGAARRQGARPARGQGPARSSPPTPRAAAWHPGRAAGQCPEAQPRARSRLPRRNDDALECRHDRTTDRIATSGPRPRPCSEPAAREARGRLKIFLGAAPGVGKTYEMLLAAPDRAASEGVDVVVGVVETHGRARDRGAARRARDHPAPARRV